MNDRVLHFIRVLLAVTLVVLPSLIADAGPVPPTTRGTSQQDTVADHHALLMQLRETRKKDSLRRIALEMQLATVSTMENARRIALEAEIKKIKSDDSVRRATLKHRVDSLRKITNGFPVVPFPGDTIFLIYHKIGGFTASERAEAISGRIREIGKGLVFNPDSLFIRDTDGTKEVLYKNRILVGITEIDALWAGKTPNQLAMDYKTRITTSIVKYHMETSTKVLLVKSGLALLVLLVLIGIIYMLNRFFRWLLIRVDNYSGRWIEGFSIKGYMLLDVHREKKVIRFILKVFRWILIIIACYTALPIMFSLFPWTRQIAEVLLGYILNPLKSIIRAVWGYMPNFFTILVIIVIFVYLLKGVKFLKNEIEAGSLRLPGFYPDLANPTYQIIRVLILAFMLVVIFPYLPGSDSPVFQGVSVFLGVLFTFGSSGSLSNLISGLVITYMRSFSVGDRVQVGNVTGDVIERSMLVTRIRTIKNEIISVPNSNVLGNHLINYSSDAQERGLIIHTTITIGYDAPWRQVHQLMIEAANDTSAIEKEPAPFVLQTALNDFYVSYEINAYTRQPQKQAKIYSDLHQNIQDKFNEAGVEIMSPHYRSERDGNATAIPPEYLKTKK